MYISMVSKQLVNRNIDRKVTDQLRQHFDVRSHLPFNQGTICKLVVTFECHIYLINTQFQLLPIKLVYPDGMKRSRIAATNEIKLLYPDEIRRTGIAATGLMKLVHLYPDEIRKTGRAKLRRVPLSGTGG